MAILLSNLMSNGALVRQGNISGGDGSVTARVFIPAGTTLADDSQLKLVRFASGVNITEIIVRAPDMDSSTGLSMSLGYARPTVKPELAFDATTNPYITGAVASASLAAYAATATAPYQAGGMIRYFNGDAGTTNEFATTIPNAGVSGIIDVVFAVTEPATGATAADGYLDVEFKYTGAQPLTANVLTQGYSSVY